ncbi:MAG: type 1 glutamine amidotransferase [Gammaproteobacteria bacterium]|nr:type 1 glutamine amidotransferase [Gammaproteobacteria bacterium]
MKPIRIFRHIECEGPAYLGIFLERNNVPYEIICIDEGVGISACLDDSSALVFMGGSMSVNDPLDWIGQELELIRQAVTQGTPVMGICFGAQLISKALGGTVGPGSSFEAGWHPLEIVDTEAGSDWLSGLPSTFNAFHWHGETFSIPEGASCILRGQCYENQAFVLGDNLALQFHLEVQEEMVPEWASLYASDLEKPSRCVQPVEQMTKDLSRKIAELHEVADVLFGEWLKRVKKRL